MGKLSGAVLILAGLALGSYTLWSAPPRSAGSEAVAVPDAAVTPAPLITPPRTGGNEMTELAAPGVPTLPLPGGPPPSQPVHPSPPPEKVGTPTTAAGAPPPASPPAPAAAPPSPDHDSRSAPPPTVQLADAPPRTPVGESKVGSEPPVNRAALTREIQRQLKRIGCYRGDANGVWSASVRQAVKAVAQRTNASLPLDQPDPILLAMVQSQPPGTCGGSCPTGQERGADGRCLPAALTASAGKGRAPTTEPAPEKTASPGLGTAPPQRVLAPTDGRMSLAGPPVDRPRQVRNPRTKGPAQRARVATQPAYSGHPRNRRPTQPSLFGYWGLPFSMP